MQDQKLKENGYETLDHHVMHGTFHSCQQDNKDIGEIRIKWEIVQCGDITVIGQQIRNKNNQYTLRQWNPRDQKASFGDDNDPQTKPICPMTFCCCYAVELLFKVTFKEVIDYCQEGIQSCTYVFDHMEKDNAG